MNKKLFYYPFLLLLLILVPACAEVTIDEDTFFDPIVEESGEEYTIGPGDVIEATYYFQPTILEEDYVLGLADVFKVEFFYHPDYDRELTVMPDGKVSLVGKGEILAVGLTVNEVKERITDLYRDIFRKPMITVSLVKYFQGVNQLKEAITTDARGQSKVLTVNPDGYISFPLISRKIRVVDLTMDELQEIVHREYEHILKHMSVSLFLESSNSNVAYVTGEVVKPNSYNIIGPTTVSQLLAMAGVNIETADLNTVLVVRKNQDNTPIAKLVNVNRVLRDGDFSQDFYLKRYDIVYVPKTRIARANQFVAQYLSGMVPDFIRIGFNYSISDRIDD